jgi:hypothetical protein
MEALERLLGEWETWAADLMETHLSYPVLCYYRSQHDNQSWLAALTTILDASAMVIVGIDGAPARQARLTFAMARHAIIDLAHVFNIPPRARDPERLLPSELTQLRSLLRATGVTLRDGFGSDEKLTELRQMYEPYVHSLSEYLLMAVPTWLPPSEIFDNWQTSAWGRISAKITSSPLRESPNDEHF